MNTHLRTALAVIFITLLSILGMARVATAASAGEIDTRVNGTLENFAKQVTGGAEFLNKADGVLVFPRVIKGGLIVGGEYGEGALRIGGETMDYYSIASGSLGLQIGGQQYAIVMVFLSTEALQKFRASKGWEAGVDGSVAIAEWGAGTDINSKSFKDPIVGFVMDNKGLMAGVSIEGSKISKKEK